MKLNTDRWLKNEITKRKASLSHIEELALARKIHDGDKAAETDLFNANLPLVLSVVRRLPDYEFAKDGKLSSMTEEDLISEGMIALQDAVRTYSPNSEARFSTYAYHWIETSVKRAIEKQNKFISIPIRVQEKIRHLQYIKSINPQISIEGISKIMEEPVSKIKDYIKWSSLQPTSLDAFEDSDETNDFDSFHEVIGEGCFITKPALYDDYYGD